MKMRLTLSALALSSVIVMTACGGGGDTPSVATTGTYPAFITVAPAGKFAYAANWGSNTISVYSIDNTTGALTPGAAIGTWTNPLFITVAPSGKFAYVTNYSSDNVSAYQIDNATGALTAVGTADSGARPTSIAIVGPSGKFAYVTNEGDGSILVYTVDTTTGLIQY